MIPMDVFSQLYIARDENFRTGGRCLNGMERETTIHCAPGGIDSRKGERHHWIRLPSLGVIKFCCVVSNC